MTLAPKIALTAGGLALIAGGALWAQFGAAVYFDILSAAFIGCFF
ncbi:hypothetical protein [Bauldia sp.]